MGYDIGPRIGIKGEAEFSAQLKKINNTLRECGSEMNALSGKFAGNEKILFANLENNPKVCDTLLFVTKKGYVKRTDPCQYCGSTQNVKGVKAIAFKAEEDEVVSIVPISEFDGITLKTETNSIHFCAENVRVMGKAAGGIKGINTDNQIISVSIGAFNKQKSQKPGGKGRKE